MELSKKPFNSEAPKWKQNAGERGAPLLEPSKKPLNVLAKRLNTSIVITLKNGVEYHGTMVRCDGYMNLLLDGASEHVNDTLVANYGNVLVRGNNILFIAIDVPHK